MTKIELTREWSTEQDSGAFFHIIKADSTAVEISFEAGRRVDFRVAAEDVVTLPPNTIYRMRSAGKATSVAVINSEEYASGVLTENLAVNVPSDHPDLQTAITRLSALRPLPDVTITINLETGYEIPTAIVLNGGDYSHITITSDDAVVGLAPGFTGHLFSVTEATAPRWEIVVDMDEAGERGLYYTRARGTVAPSCGVVNAGTDGLVVIDRSQVTAYQSVFDGALGNGISVQTVSDCFCDEVSAQNCGLSGLVMGSSSRVRARNANFDGSSINGSALIVAAGIIVDRSSLLDARGATARNCPYRAAWIDNGSMAMLRDMDGSGAGDNGFWIARGSIVSLEGARADNCGVRAFSAGTGAQVNANLFNASGYTGVGPHIYGQNAVIRLPNADLSCVVQVQDCVLSLEFAQNHNATGNAFAFVASKVAGRGLQVSNAAGVGLLIQASEFSAPLSQITNCVGRGVDAQHGSMVRLIEATVTGNGGDDVRVATGSQAFLNGATTTNGVGTPNISDVNLSSFNAIQGNFGIIWD